MTHAAKQVLLDFVLGFLICGLCLFALWRWSPLFSDVSVENFFIALGFVVLGPISILVGALVLPSKILQEPATWIMLLSFVFGAALLMFGIVTPIRMQSESRKARIVSIGCIIAWLLLGLSVVLSGVT